MNAVTGTAEERVEKLVHLLEDYRFYYDVHLIFDSPNDFLHSQRGQFKIDNSILEEFLPHLICPEIVPELAGKGFTVGSVSSLLQHTFTVTGGVEIAPEHLEMRVTDMDFAIAQKIHLRAALNPEFNHSATTSAHMAVLGTECKTQLDKTMFQEACGTARLIKSVMQGAKYFVLCE